MSRQESNIIHRISSDASSEAAYYRFMNNERVSLPQMIGHIVAPLRQKAAGRQVLIIGDSSEFSLKARAAHIEDAASLGVLSDNRTPGFHMHVNMCVDAQSGHGLGLSDLLIWNRPVSYASQAEKQLRKSLRLPSEKESYKWRLGLTHSLEVVSQANQATFVFDAEADQGHLWHGIFSTEAEAVIRMRHNWSLDLLEEQGKSKGPTGISAWIARQPCAGQYMIDLRKLDRPNYSRNQPQNRQARRAQIDVRFSPVQLRALADQASPLYLVEAKENNRTLPKGEKPVHWLLLTTHRVSTFEEACQIIQWYRYRWMIEELFRLTKRKGFRLESSGLTRSEAILKQTVATFEAAFRVLTLLLARDQADTQPIEEIFEQDEIQCLKALNQKYQGKTQKQQNPFPPKQLSWATWIIGRLGGWKGYASRRPPGPIRLKQGMERFYAIFEGWTILNQQVNMSDP